jgi:hypothetical protein
VYRVWWGNLRERVHLEDPIIDERIILKWVFKKWDGAWTGSVWIRAGELEGSCECGNEPSVSIKFR